jgi:hypothetical protein
MKQANLVSYQIRLMTCAFWMQENKRVEFHSAEGQKEMKKSDVV